MAVPLPSSATGGHMKRTRQVTVALVFAVSGAAFGVAACSKSDDKNQPHGKNPQPAQEKPVTAPPAAPVPPVVQPIDSEGFIGTVPPKVTGSFADGEAAYRAKKYADAVAIFDG